MSKYGPNDELVEFAKKFKTRSELKAFDGNKIFQVIKARGLLKECTAHMVDQRTVKSYSDDDIVASAAQFNKLKDWRIKCRQMYKLAKHRGLLQRCTNHMERSRSVYEGSYQVYAYEFSDNHAYVGLTTNWKVRHDAHTKYGPVYEHACASGLSPTLKTLVPQGALMSPYAAGESEREWKRTYEINGWTMLNSAECGSTGNISKKSAMTVAEIRESASRHSSKSEWADADHRAYVLAKEFGVFDEVTARMRKKPLTDETRERMSAAASNRKVDGYENFSMAPKFAPTEQVDGVGTNRRVYVVCGPSGSGKSYVCTQLSEVAAYVPYDQYSGFDQRYDALVQATRQDKPILYDPVRNVVSFKRKNSHVFDVVLVVINESVETLCTRIRSRGGIPNEQYLTKRAARFLAISRRHTSFSGTSGEVLAWLRKALTA